MKFEIPVITAEELVRRVQTNMLGTRFRHCVTLLGEDEQSYGLYVDEDYNETVVAVLDSDDD